MNLKEKMMKVGLASILSILPFTTNISAIETDVIDEKWGKPTVVYGGGLNEYQVEQTADLFGINNRDNVYEMYVDANDVGNYLGYWQGSTNVLISSVMVQKKSSGGVVVNIITPDLITRITEEQYANAAITAGVADCEIDVASIQLVTGESALTGVYKAFEANGVELDLERTEVAQEELEITNEIAQENLSEDGFNSNVLDQTIVEIKQEMAEVKEKNGEITAEDIEQIVINIINKYGLDQYLTQENINKLISFAEKYANTSAIDSKEVLRQLKELSGSFGEDIQSLIKQAADSGLLGRIINFFRNLLGL